MRIGAVIALIAFAVGGLGALVNTVNSPDSGPATIAGQTLQDTSGNGPKPTPGEDSTRLAQNIRVPVDRLEATSGNPAFLPLIWVGLLVVPEPSPSAPNAIGLCTAEFISPTVLLTAAHCLQDLTKMMDDKPDSPPRQWPDITKGVFYRQYQNDSGVAFNIVCGLTNPKWVLPSNFTSMKNSEKNAAMNVALQHDYAMILVDKPNANGGMPYALDWKGRKDANTAIRVGYPGAILDAAIVQRVPGVVFFASAIPGSYQGMTNEIVHWGPSVDATQGMSGGPWIINFDTSGNATDANTIIGVTSFVDNGFPGGAFAAYLTAAEFNPLLNSVTNGCK
jgi:hypothetical protein